MLFRLRFVMRMAEEVFCDLCGLQIFSPRKGQTRCDACRRDSGPN